MQKVYRLLRNNQETGPYALEEILQLNLKPFDLVWVDGRSAAWRYPSEIESLKAFVPEVIQAQSPYEPIATAAMEKEIVSPSTMPPKEISKKVFVSMPGKVQQPTSTEKKEAAIPSYSSPQIQSKNYSEPVSPPKIETADEDLVQTKYVRSINDVEEDYSRWVYQQKTKPKSKVSTKDLAIAAVVIALIIGGYFIISKPSIVDPITSNQRTSPIYSQEKEISPAAENQETELAPPASNQAIKSIQKKTTNRKVLPVNKRENNAISSGEIHASENSTHSTKEEVTQVTRENSPSKTQPAAKKEKKKLGERLKSIFTKKDPNSKSPTPNEKPVLEEPKPATNRQSTKRNEGEETAAEPDHATLVNKIDVTSNAPDNWMMGVTGLKVTVRNSNNVALQTVSVQVLYYDENDQLLDKKTIYFNNVPAKGKLTVAAPDHKFADHVEFRLLTANAKDDRFANNSY